MAKLYFKYGTMASGKSTKLLKKAYNYDKYNTKIIVAKPKVDTKGDNDVVSRIGIKRTTDVLLFSDDLEELHNKIELTTACILIDEAQFLNEKQVYELFLISKKLNIPVMCYGLKFTSDGKLFQGSETLFAYSDSLEEIFAICSCGKKARFNTKKVNDEFVNDEEEIVIDNNYNVKYVSLCEECYQKKVNNCKIKRKKLNKI